MKIDEKLHFCDTLWLDITLTFFRQTFDAVTILFSYLVGFKDICSNGSAMDIVRVMNNSFMVFDPIVDKYGLFKVRILALL